MRCIALATLALTILPATADAHIRMTFPTNRYGDEQKSEPCGRAGGARSGNVNVFEPGETITIEFTETIDHPSHYRVSFDSDGDDDFCYPASMDDFFTCDTVVLDNIADAPAAAQTIEFTFPDIECENCTLQVVQVMYDKASIWGDNDLYFNCADIALRAADPNAPDAGTTPDPDPEVGGDGGCAVAHRDAGGAPLGVLLLISLVALSSRRRR